jgi:hypothetical protein
MSKPTSLNVVDNTLIPIPELETKDEMKRFLAVILNMGIIKLQDLKDYWSTHTTPPTCHSSDLSFSGIVFY